MTNQNISAYAAAIVDSITRLLNAYPMIYLACHRRHVRESEAGDAITERQASLLDHLDPTHPKTISKLAQHHGVSVSSMSIMVAVLEQKGYIARSRSKIDRRSVGLTLTKAGAKIKENNAVLDRDLMRQMFRLMPPKELEAALQGMECLAKYAAILLQQRQRERKK